MRILPIIILFALIGTASAQFPYWEGYYGFANSYWSSSPAMYSGSNPSYSHYNIFSPGGYYYGASLYDQGRNQWAYWSINGRYGQGYSTHSPYGWR